MFGPQLDGQFQHFNDLGTPELDLDHPTHVSPSAFMNGQQQLYSPDGVQSANGGILGHELSSPMQTHQATFMQGQPNETNVWNETGFANTSFLDKGQASAAVSRPTSPIQLAAIIPCNYPTSNKMFTRGAYRTRHEQSVHFKNSGLHLCHISGCQKHYGKGYSRPDKVTKHLCKKHVNLGFTKA
jgi:hypothetical protein